MYWICILALFRYINELFIPVRLILLIYSIVIIK